MSEIQFLPLGNQCRTAFQLRQFCHNKNNVSVKSNPFDWAISPIASLKVILSSDFNPEEVLNPDLLTLSANGSVICKYSKLNFHHDLPPSLVDELNIKEDAELIKMAGHKKLWEAKERFIHTNMNLTQAIQARKMIAVRWLHSPSHSLKYENEGKIFELISNKRGNNNFNLVYFYSEYDDNLTESSNYIHNLTVRESKILKCCLKERSGFNGDLTRNFRGDSRSWNNLLQYVLEYYAL